MVIRANPHQNQIKMKTCILIIVLLSSTIFLKANNKNENHFENDDHSSIILCFEYGVDSISQSQESELMEFIHYNLSRYRKFYIAVGGYPMNSSYNNKKFIAKQMKLLNCWMTRWGIKRTWLSYKAFDYYEENVIECDCKQIFIWIDILPYSIHTR